MSDEEQSRKKKSREKPIQYWVVRVLVVLIPAFFSYCQAKSEAETEARSIVKKQAGQIEDVAGAGYQEMVQAVKHLDEELSEYRKELYSMKGHIEALENRASMRMRVSPTPVTSGRPDAGVGISDAGSGSADGDGIPDYPAAPPEKSPLEVAPDLNKAAAKYGVPQMSKE